MKHRGREHTTLTETAKEVVRILERTPGVKMIAPGMITNTGRKGAGTKHLTAVYTNAGFELSINGQGNQKISVHTDRNPKTVFAELVTHKKLQHFIIKERERKPGT